MSDNDNQRQMEYLSQFDTASINTFIYTWNDPESILREKRAKTSNYLFFFMASHINEWKHFTWILEPRFNRHHGTVIEKFTLWIESYDMMTLCLGYSWHELIFVCENFCSGITFTIVFLATFDNTK